MLLKMFQNCLHPADFELNFAPMNFSSPFFQLLFAALLALCVAGRAAAAESPLPPPALPQHPPQQPWPAEEPSLLERYTTNAQDLILKGLELVGINYRFGGTNPDSGLDCSGFVQIVFKDALGKLLPRTAREQSQVGDEVSRNELKPGDLVFFNTMRHAFSHVGIYLGDNHFVHAPRTGSEIRVEDMSQSYWAKRYNGARRVLKR